eukprot:TCALIF_13008-PA protein Name:"Similar to Ift81 Intraflagellar transport protein 81 homolog (Mus musculus)" AED:0.03 eAED:0.03 QI:0/1/0.5/1/1/1/2/161/727
MVLCKDIMSESPRLIPASILEFVPAFDLMVRNRYFLTSTQCKGKREKMGEVLKFIVETLNSTPYFKNLNLISFDSLAGEQYLQILSDVLSEIESKSPIDIREEDTEVTIVRILACLRMLKYKPPSHINAQVFREGLLLGSKAVIYPILDWLLRRQPELKTRAYLARFLIKVDIPGDYLADADVLEVSNQYDGLIEEFKLAHKEVETLKSSGYGTSELRRDIEEMENESEVVEKRIERIQRKLDGMPTLNTMLETAKSLRQQKERDQELQSQKEDQRNMIHHIDQRITRLESQLSNLKQSSTGATSDGLIQKLTEENNVNAYLVTQKLPKELSSKRNGNNAIDKVISQAALGKEDIAKIKSKIDAVSKELVDISNKRNVTNDPIEDKLTLFRQQAAIIGRKKSNTAEKLNDVRTETAALTSELTEMKDKMQSFSGETIVRGDDFKKYVSSLRSKSTVYKQRRAVFSELKAEYGILSRTFEILNTNKEYLAQMLEKVETEKGIQGFRHTQDTMEKLAVAKADLDDQKGQTLDDMSGLVQELTMKISERKAQLAPIIKELRPLRQQCQELQTTYDEKKMHYDTLLLQLESGMTRLENEVKKIQDEILRNEREVASTDIMHALNLQWLQRAENELKLYVARNAVGTDQPNKGWREEILKLISVQEKRGKMLKEEQMVMKESSSQVSRQIVLWSDMAKLFSCKLLVKDQQKNSGGADMGTITRDLGTETLVL